ncbi:MAG: hypothetical protein LBJ01_09875 [Tannerella sp.]|jgi:hypothetical protein|nr:hypothetical protein [Tannerella sp.]
MKTVKVVTPISDGVNRRFFIAIDALVTSGRLASLQSFCTGSGLSASRYREARLTYGVTPHPASKPSRYKTIEIEALYSLARDYAVSAEWLLTGRGKMFKTEDG